MTIDTKWFRDRLAEAGLSQRQLAKNTVRRGYKRGRYNVTGPAGTMIDVNVEIFVPTLAIRTQSE